MSSKKRQWQEPLIKSIDQCRPVFGECRVGNSPTEGGDFQCNTGTGATTGGNCTTGNGAKQSCNKGSGVVKI